MERLDKDIGVAITLNPIEVILTEKTIDLLSYAMAFGLSTEMDESNVTK
jgi:hypothetical protein